MTDGETPSLETELPAAAKPARRADGERRKKRPSVGTIRRQSRELALQTLFEADLTGHGTDEIMARVRASQELQPRTYDYFLEIVHGVTLQRDRLDDFIGDAAPAFPVGQLATVDRNVLRIALFEILEKEDVPPKAAINEAVDLAKRFGGDNSGRFVNGVLGTVFARVQRERGGDPEPPA